MKLTLNGKPPCTSTLSPAMRRVVNFVLNLPDGKLLTAKGLAEETGISRGRCSNYANEHVPPTHWIKDGSQKIYGNPKTLAAYKKLRHLET